MSTSKHRKLSRAQRRAQAAERVAMLAQGQRLEGYRAGYRKGYRSGVLGALSAALVAAALVGLTVWALA